MRSKNTYILRQEAIFSFFSVWTAHWHIFSHTSASHQALTPKNPSCVFVCFVMAEHRRINRLPLLLSNLGANCPFSHESPLIDQGISNTDCDSAPKRSKVVSCDPQAQMQLMLGVDFFFFFKSHDLHVLAHEDQSQSKVRPSSHLDRDSCFNAVSQSVWPVS